MASLQESSCPGCGLRMPVTDRPVDMPYFNASPECWLVTTEVLAAEYENAALFGQVHQLTVDTYAVQHAGGPHPDKSVAVHLAGLHLVLIRGLPPTSVPPLLQRLASTVSEWPHFDPPSMMGTPTACDVALAGSPDEHRGKVRDWAAAVWAAWSPHHPRIATFVDRHLPRPSP